MKLAYKAFNEGWICRGYQFKLEEWNEEGAANCVKNGFHCAENPLDCLCHYPSTKGVVYAVVACDGDLDEDACDSKIACTRMKIIKELSLMELLAEGLRYLYRYPKRKRSGLIKKDRAEGGGRGYAVCAGRDPLICGKIGDILCYVVEDGRGRIAGLQMVMVDGEIFLEDRYYSVNDIFAKQYAGAAVGS